MKLVCTIKDRLLEAMAIRGLKQVDLSNKTGISKSKISHYCKGTYEPKQDGLYLLAKALNVSAEWLMGLDVPMEDQKDSLGFTHALYNDEETKWLTKEQKDALYKMFTLFKESNKNN